MIIDAHVHIGLWDYQWYAHLKVTLQNYAALMSQYGIEKAVLFPSDRRNNDAVLSELSQLGADRFWFFAWVNPNDPNVSKFLRERMAQISGLKFHSSLDCIEGGVNNSLYKSYLSMAERHGLPVLVHCGRWQQYAGYQLALEAAERHPNLTFILSHLGGDFEQLKIEAPKEVRERGLSNVYFDISATREFWTIAMAANVLGPERLIFGSDYPVMHPAMSIASIEVLRFNEREKDLIYSGNILRILDPKSVHVQ